MTTISFNFTEIPSLKNNKTIHYNKSNKRMFVATESKTKEKMSALARQIRNAIQKQNISREKILSGKVLPLDDSIQWIGFPSFGYEMTNRKLCQFCEIDFVFRSQRTENRPHIFGVNGYLILHGNTSRDSDNIVSSLLDAYLDALCDLCYLSRTELRSHATRIFNQFQ